MKNSIQKKWMLLFMAFFFIFSGTTTAASYVVSGAGSSEVNGTYIETGTWNEKSLYIYNNDGTEYIIGYNMGRWMIGRWMIEFEFIDSYYDIMSEADTPPSTGWERMMGMDPTPTVVMGVRSLSYSASLFTEHTNNDGSISNSILISFNEYEGDTFTGSIDDNFVTENKVTVSNVPAGLTAAIIKTAGDELTFSLTGNASSHEQTDGIDNITLTFQNTAFVQENAADVSNYSKSDFGIFYTITFSGGAGTEGSPYLISNKTDLKILSENWGVENLWNKYYQQTTNISFEASDFQSGGDFHNGEEGWIPIGNGSTNFTGIYDGQDHTISNLFVNRSAEYQGLFGYISSSGSKIENLGVINVDVNGANNTGALLGTNDQGNISNCFSTGVVSGSNWVGGLVGKNMYGPIKNSYSACIMSGISSIGGLVGISFYCNISNSYSTGDIKGNSRVGGLVGENVSTINNCYSTGNVARNAEASTSYTSFGGFVGWHGNYPITNSYSTGSVSYVGSSPEIRTDKGFAGYLHTISDGSFHDCFWDTETSGSISSGGYAGITGKTTAQMKTQATFTGWNFATTPIWEIDGINNSGYPYLTWQSFPIDAPSVQASTLVFSAIHNYDMTISWTYGNGDARVVFVKEGTGAISNPVNQTTYTASSDWEMPGTQLDASGYYCVYNGTGNSVTVTNLAKNTQYNVQVIEYNGDAGTEVYSTVVGADNPKSQTTTNEAGTGYNAHDESKLMLYPNPVSDVFYIEGLSEVTVISIIDLSGRTLIQKQVSDNEAVYVNQLPKGNYVLKIINNESTSEHKLLKR
jgi:hypothetical protein